MITAQQKNYIILGLALVCSTLIISQFVFSRKQSNEVHPSLIPVNVSSDSKKTEMRTPYEQNQVRNTLVKHNSEIQDCYLLHLKTPNATTMGKVLVDWNISPEGKVISPQVISSNMNSKELGDCIVGKMQKIEFPPPPSDKPVYASFSYVFHKENESLAPQLFNSSGKKINGKQKSSKK